MTGIGDFSISNDNGQLRLNQNSFGVNSGEMIKALVDAKRIPLERKALEIDQNTTKLAELSKLEDSLSALKGSLDLLRNPRLGSTSPDVFDSKTASVQASGDIAPSQLMGISIDDGADLGNFDLTITQVASTDTLSSGPIATTATDPLLTGDGNLVLNGETVALTQNMSLIDVRDAVNASAAASGIRATLVDDGGGSYYLTLKGTETGQAIDLQVDATVGGDLKLTDQPVTAARTDALVAQLELDGVAVQRTSNSISDLVDGVNFELFRADPGNPMTVTVEEDLSNVNETIATFVETYNALVEFTDKQTAVLDGGERPEGAVLFNNNVLRGTTSQLKDAVSGAVAGLGTDSLESLAEIGIDLGREGKLSIDQAELEDALLADLGKVRELFGFQPNTSSTQLSVIDRPDFLPPELSGTNAGKAITVDVTAVDGNGTPTTADLTIDGGMTVPATIENGLIKGPEGSALEGFIFGYDAGSVGSATATPTQGIADRMAAYLDGVLGDGGTMQQERERISGRNDRIEAQIERMETRVESYEQRLIAQFSAMEDAIAQLESVQNFLDNTIKSMTQE